MSILPLMLSILANVTTDSWTESMPCVNDVILTYFREKNLVLVTDSGILKDLSASVNKAVVPYSEKEVRLGNLFLYDRYDVLVYGLQNLNQLRYIFGNASTNPKGKVVIATENESEESAKEIISILWNSKRITNVIVLALGMTPIKAYSWFPYSRDECTTVKTLTLLDECVHGSLKRGVNVLPDKISKNLNGCEVLASTRRIEPYVFAPGQPGYYDEGYEIRIMEEFKNSYNMNLRYIDPPDLATFYISDTSGRVHSGVFTLLLTQKVDLIFGGMMARQDRFQVTEALYPHMIESLIWTYPKPGYKTNFYSIYITFSIELWVFIILFHFFAAAAFYVISKIRNRGVEIHYHTFSTCFFRSLAILCNINVPQPRTIRLRFVFLSYIIYALHLCTAYQSYLIFLLTHSERYKPVRDVEKLVDGGMTAYLFYSGNFMYNKSDHETWNKIFRPGGNKYVDGLDLRIFLNDIAFNRSSFLLFPKSSIDYLRHLMYADKGESLFGYLTYITYPLVMYVSPGNPLRDMFSDRILALAQNGIFQQWQKIITREQVSASKKSYNMTEDPGNVEALSLKHLEGAFLLWFVSIALSFIVFVGEIIYHKITKPALSKRKTN